MVSTKGTPLDMLKQTTKLGLKNKLCTGVKTSRSVLNEKLNIDKKLLVTDEQKAIMRMLLIIKQMLERQKGPDL